MATELSRFLRLARPSDASLRALTLAFLRGFYLLARELSIVSPRVV
jgi:hypothetical protein